MVWRRRRRGEEWLLAAALATASGLGGTRSAWAGRLGESVDAAGAAEAPGAPTVAAALPQSPGTPQPPVPPATSPSASGTEQGSTAPPQALAGVAATGGGTVHGTIVAGTVAAPAAGAPGGKPIGVPLPGVAITATNTLTGRKYAAATDADGAFTMRVPRRGRYVLRAELAGFAPVTTEVVVNEATPEQTANLGMQLASRAEATAAEVATGSDGAGAGTTSSLLRSLQSLNLNAGSAGAEDASAGGGNAGAALPSLGSVGSGGGSAGDASGSDTVAVSGQSGQTNGLAGISEDDLRNRIQEGVAAARASGQLPPGVDPTNAIVGIIGSFLGGPGRGGPGGGGRGGGGFGRGSGAFNRLNPTQLHGGFNYGGEYANFDAAPWSPTLLPQTNPPFAKNNFGATLAGSPYLPGLTKPSTKQFGFLNFNFARNTTPEVLTGTVPTPAERGGDFSGLTQTTNGQTALTPIYDPTTGQPFVFGGQANVINPARITPQALSILNGYYPLPNVPGAGTQNFNYQTVTTAGNNTANLSARFIRSLGSNSASPFGGFGGGRGGGGRTPAPGLRQSLNFNFSYSHAASDIRNIILPLSGASSSDGYNLGAGYVLGRGRLNNNASVTWNRSHALTRNYFTNTGNDPAAAAGITLPSTGALGTEPNFYNGVPALSIENFLSVNNTNPQDNIGQTISFTDQVSYRHHKHNLRFGVDLRRVHQDYLGGGTPLGSFTFTGFNTESPNDQAAATNAKGTVAGSPAATGQAVSGSAFADFLLGLPQQTQIQAGLAKIYLRENVLDWYANDDFRVADGLTINGGLRYEYFGPFSEKNGRLVNLTGVSSGTTAVGCVTPNGVSVQTVAGALTCAPGRTSSLLEADRSMFSPRFGLAYRPHFLPRLTKETVVRAGYGINFNTSQFSSFARSLSYQAPFAAAQNNVLSTPNNQTGCVGTTDQGQASNLTLANGFSCSTKLYQNTYAVNPNYRLGYVQIYNVDVQRGLPWGVVLNLGYNGSHGDDLNVTRAPNHTSSSVTTPNAVAFTYQDSLGESTFNALTINVQKRLQKGLQLAAKYQYAHSIDDASSFGGAASPSSIQNDEDLHAERANSSFDVRHQLTGSWLFELPVGPNRPFLNKGGVAAKLLDGFSVSGTYTLASGTYLTPSYQSTAAQIAAGGTYTLRPDRVFTTPIRGAGQLRSFFNASAFAYPVSATGYGTASRYSIEGPGQVLVSSSLSRTVPLGETRSFEARVTANNVFNTVQYNGINTTLDSATFGQVTGAAALRQILFVGRFRF